METRAAFYLLIITCVTLILINFDLNNKLHQVNQTKEYYKHRHQVTQELYDLMRDEVLRLEDENQLLGSIVAQNEIKNQ